MLRRRFLAGSATALMAPFAFAGVEGVEPVPDDSSLKLFLAGDVMTGRGIDQILPRSSSPEIYEQWLRSASDYISVAELVNGPIPRKVGYRYIWGDALTELDSTKPDVRIVNLETAVTISDEPWPGKGIHYRMHPANTEVLAVAGIDCCTLANNHVLDWGHDGLEETLQVLKHHRIAVAGAGMDREGAMTPAIINAGNDSRVLVFSLGHGSSGISPGWSAGEKRPGVWRLASLSNTVVQEIMAVVQGYKREGDIAIASIHWGGNWGYHLDPDMRQFAHNLIDHAGIDLVHGHSSHHPRGIEVYEGRLILYGCGDFINDYEGIRGHEKYRGDLRVMYLPRIDLATGKLNALRMPVFQTHRFSLRSAKVEDIHWLAEELDRESRSLGSSRIEAESGELVLRWG